MSHVVRNRAKLLARTRRIGGQLSAIERALTDGVECVAVLTQIAAVRGAVQGLLLEVLSDPIWTSMLPGKDAAVSAKRNSPR